MIKKKNHYHFHFLHVPCPRGKTHPISFRKGSRRESEFPQRVAEILKASSEILHRNTQAVRKQLGQYF